MSDLEDPRNGMFIEGPMGAEIPIPLISGGTLPGSRAPCLSRCTERECVSMAFAGTLLINEERSESLSSNFPAILHLPEHSMAGWGTGQLVHAANLAEVQLQSGKGLIPSWAR